MSYKNVIYIGQYEVGSTSRMRGEILKQVLAPKFFYVMNTSIPIQNTSRLFRSLGWRYKIGPLVANVNAYIQELLKEISGPVDLVWVDKGVFIHPRVINLLRQLASVLVHFTPDPAFTYHKSNMFYDSLALYDFVITTKSFEVDFYEKYGAKKILYCTQGYDRFVHKPFFTFEEKEGISFIGHRELIREKIIEQLLYSEIPIKLAGVGWGSFAKRHQKKNNLQFLGKGLFGDEYSRAISSSLLSLGFLSKIIPELHTTRTIEIPACGTALVTERTTEVYDIFGPDAVFYIDNFDDWLPKIQHILLHPEEIRAVTKSGYDKIVMGKYDYESIILDILQKM